MRPFLRGAALAATILAGSSAQADAPAPACGGRPEPPPCTAAGYSSTSRKCQECADAASCATLAAQGYTQGMCSRPHATATGTEIVTVVCGQICPSDILTTADGRACSACAAGDDACRATLQQQDYAATCLQPGSDGDATVLCRAACTAAELTTPGLGGRLCQECAADDAACVEGLTPSGYGVQCTDPRAGGEVAVLCKPRCSAQDAGQFLTCEECAQTDMACLAAHDPNTWWAWCTDRRPEQVQLFCKVSSASASAARRGAAVPAAGVMLLASALASLGLRRKRDRT